MQTLRKKTSPLKYKNETTRFLGDGVSFKAKLIGILEVSEARGDRMCQEALSDLKMAIRAAGEHKQRITINIAIDGLRLRDEKTGDSLYHHPVHKISFIAQDMTDSRAFGYIFGSPDTGHRFFGIKTDKAASQVVIAMRDLFQVVFALKKKEIELAKQHLEKTCYPSSPLFSDISSSKLQSVPNVSIKSLSEAKASASNESKNSGTAVADLVDLELELNSLQQGLNQMERITPSDPFGAKDDPFGDSFISYPAKPILPPPPSSGRERSSRTSETSSLFSPKTPHTGATINTEDSDKKNGFSFSQDFNSSHEVSEPSSGDWFTPSAGNSIFEDTSPVPESMKDEKHEQAKKEIMSQFDVFTELDPLELKNPPKKALNELANNPNQDQPLFNPSFNQANSKAPPAGTQGVFTDPFGEDPFVKEDPFPESEFSRQDPFETEFSAFPVNQNGVDARKDSLQLAPNNRSLSPMSLGTEKHASALSTSPKTVFTTKQPTFEVHFDRLSKAHENPSLDVSSESECAPEPPPRPTTDIMYIKPPPLPPKKQTSDLASKPPPRPPYHSEDSPYDFIERYETAPNSLGAEKSPPLPVPARKAKFEDGGAAPERPKKHFNVSSSEEDYLTPISFPEKGAGVLLPPPQKSTKKQAQVTAESQQHVDNLEGLDITLSQLTLSGLNELANKLHIPASQLSNMTLVQLTNFLSNFIKSGSAQPESDVAVSNTITSDFATFQADFAANFSNSNNSASTGNDASYDRYAVFRELMHEEIKQTKIDSEPEEILEEKEKMENSMNSNIDLELKPLNEEPSDNTDRYAALREIVEIELKQLETQVDEINQNQTSEIENIAELDENEEEEPITKEPDAIGIINEENKLHSQIKDQEVVAPIQTTIIEYITPTIEDKNGIIDIDIVPVKSPVKSTMVKSPVPCAVTEIIQNNTRLTSGSLSDVVSGSSPEVDNTASNSDVGKKSADVTGESWAIFDQASAPIDPATEKQAVQSEEGVSPWSSDSKEFGEGSPPGWRSRDSGSGNERYLEKRRDKDGWWDTSAEPEVHYCPSNRRSTDSYEEEHRERYERPRRRRQPAYPAAAAAPTAGGHSSSSRDVSPWEEEPRRAREGRGKEGRAYGRVGVRGASFERRRRRATDSWDEEDDYDYDDEHRFHWSDRHKPRDTDRESRHSTGSREHEGDRWGDEWIEDRRHRRRREPRDARELRDPREARDPRDPRDRWCCPDWDESEHGKPPRYGAGRRPTTEPTPSKWRQTDDRYYGRESPWEDEYADEPEEAPHYPKKGWKQRPSSASEMDRKTGDVKTRHHLGIGGSDGERERRYKSGRRSRSRDSQYSEPSHRHKPDQGAPARAAHRTKQHQGDFPESISKKSLEAKLETKKASTLSRKKTKDSPKSEEPLTGTFPRSRGMPATVVGKFFDNDLETSEAESPIISRPIKNVRQQSMFEKSSHAEKDFKGRQRGGSLRDSKLSPRYQAKSHFEDDFSPGDKSEQPPQEGAGISSIEEEVDRENEDEFGASNFENAANGRRKILSKNRLSLRTDVGLKKSDSVNIFAREDDPFDDDFFCGEEMGPERKSPRSTELRWTDDFEN
ncbi:unnamed protein product [Phaedon cochleariae]|uniref:PID domain-containing protein n=1 Tax=Phaedon cochleariae TaxID=80249 RepID=A0A9P0DTG6_PHACE|nr:unnamed protein product [Phaedon cochleariae]